MSRMATRTLNLAEGWVPIPDLPKIAEASQTVGGTAVPIPHVKQQGASPNQSRYCRQRRHGENRPINVNGAGQTIGVLSTSANLFSQVGDTGAANALTGLAASVRLGRPAAECPGHRSDLMADGDPNASDEGRAMLEQIYDLAPGGSTRQFATAFSGDVQFGTNIEALYAAGSRTIVDDAAYDDEPLSTRTA